VADAFRGERLAGPAADGDRDDRHLTTGTPATVSVPAELSDVLGGSRVTAGSALRLGAWDVRVFATAELPSA